jgi:ADP-L-glycero-D-manno-heptose 6-epimerase
MTIVVTGAAGFIGSNLVRALNQRGQTDIIAVDNLTRGDKIRNLADCDIADFIDKQDFLNVLTEDGLDSDCRAIFHLGACSDTMESDGRYMMANNYRYSCRLLDACQDADIALIYASSASTYGNGLTFVENRPYEAPLNVYAYSKFLFDQRVRQRLADNGSPIVGLRYFNVYGPRESHKGRMASTAFHFYNQFLQEGHVRLFEGCDGYGNGEQRRDFVSVDDAVAMNLHFFDHPELSGIFNCGTGRAQSFNEMAAAVINAVAREQGEAGRTIAELQSASLLRYVPFPPALVGKYQSFTQADLTKVRAAGYGSPFLTVEEGVERYVQQRQGRG